MAAFRRIRGPHVANVLGSPMMPLAVVKATARQSPASFDGGWFKHEDKGGVMRLHDKVAIVTGGAQGIGREYCLRFASEGASVVVADLRIQQAKAVATEIGSSGGKALAVEADVADEASAEGMAQAAIERFGGIDVLVNNAAIYYDLDVRDSSIEYLRKVLDVNLIGTLICSRAVLPSMRERGGGSIINISSVAAYPSQISFRPAENFPNYAYGISKSAVVHLTKSMARTAGADNIRVNAIAPGTTLTKATLRVLPEKAVEAKRHLKALGKSLQPYDLTGTALYLASDDSAMMTGQTLVVDAGDIMIG